jgi:serine protease AprX
MGAATASGALPAKFDPAILAPGASPRAIVGFSHDIGAGVFERLAAAGITSAVRIDTIDAVGVLGPVSAYKKIAAWSDVTYVDDDSKIEFDNYSAKKDTHVDQVRKGAGLKSKYTGKGVTVAVIDTGIWSPHPDLTDRVIKHLNFEPAWTWDQIHDGGYTDQISEATGSPLDTFGHGTHVAGTVAGTGAAAGTKDPDMSGVAPGAKLVDFNISQATQSAEDIGWEVNALVAYEYLIEHRNDKEFGPHGIQIATNSWSVYEVDSDAEPITLMVQHAADKGIINVFAASNDGCGDPKVSTVAPGPNSLEDVITVAASCKSDGCGLGMIAGFSSCGPEVDVTAPGVDIYSTMAPSEDGAAGGHNPPGAPTNKLYYMAISGTSMATPHVSGIVALMLEANPNLTHAQVEKLLTKTAVDYGDKGFDIHFGFGQVDALKAVAGAERVR